MGGRAISWCRCAPGGSTASSSGAAITVFGYVDRCPHMGLPLAQKLDDYLAGGMIACSWHGAMFAVEDGACVGGPCVGASLTRWPVIVAAGEIVTV